MPVNERLIVSKQKPVIYCESLKGYVYSINYVDNKTLKLKNIIIDSDFGFLVSPVDKWVVHMESKNLRGTVLLISRI